MSAPDIGALFVTYNAALNAYAEATQAISRAAAEVVLAEFGPWDGNPELRRWEVGTSSVSVGLHRRDAAWVATVDVEDDWTTARADTPTAAVRQALDALAETHPTEAAELRKAVTFKEAP